MAYNRKTIVKDGEVGFIIRTPLIQDNGEAVDLVLNSGWTFRLAVTAKDGITLLIDQAMLADANQVTYPNYIAYEMTASDFTALKGSIPVTTSLEAEGKVEFDMEFIALKPGSKKEKFPKDEKERFATLVLLDAKS